jgi:pimeloyl-ACP methyl ester carboxylesterase
MMAPHLILLPGLGADRRFLTRQLADFPDAIIPAWIPPEKRETLPHYAERMAALVSKQLDRPCIVGGVSLGGMVALEMARHLRAGGGGGDGRIEHGARAAVLISSCTEPSPVHPFLRFCEFALRPVPERVISWSLFAAPIVLGRGGTIPREDRRLLARMVREVPLSFIRWGGRAVLEWSGLRDSGIPIRAIHGSRDWVISPRKVRPDVMVENGPHVLNISHPREVNAFLRDCLAAAT